ncbi:ABC transporter substrate-binding protein [Halocatena salina]|uniref:ABC transporter substrate-binding protein n=1 Tax=Halocatena salina TaxID=2934340 RepID=A0A8U0A703_9EURY|nr:ABC transporter substrate-binding protein [Halocatena salina]UPM43697.1 ABC transporter substrate-binding protein [Halocatena salina]
MRRRNVLTLLAVSATALTSGCIRRLRTITGWEPSDQITLEIKTVSADADPYALRLANQVAEWLRTGGIDTNVTPMSDEELLRQVLLKHEFDLFVTRAPQWVRQPDGLYSLLHSGFTTASGWQNPFGYANLNVDGLLQTQRTDSGKRRQEAVSQLQQTVANSQPFTPLALADDIRAVRSDRYTNWRSKDLRSSLGYLALDRVAEDERDEDAPSPPEELGVVMNDTRLTTNLNPLSVEFRRTDDLTGLLYDSLGYASGLKTVDPWLADSWEFSKGNSELFATVRIPSGLTWHDGTPLTAEDVAFTYAFLSDTTLGSGIEDDSTDDTTAVPVPRFHGQSDLVSTVRVVDPQTAEFRFGECHPQAAKRAFTVPILPKHIWNQRTNPSSIGGIEVGTATDALVTKNIPPIGSGPLVFAQNDPQRSVTFDTFDNHFLARTDESKLPNELASGPAFDRLTVRAVGSDVAAVEMVASGETDVTGTAVGADKVPRIGRKSVLDLVVNRSTSLYMVGYNARQSPLANARIRNTIAQLIDKRYLVEDIFNGYAQPAVSPLTGTDWLPESLQWDETDPVTPFLGTDGELDVAQARKAFQTAGYQFDDGKLVGK